MGSHYFQQSLLDEHSKHTVNTTGGPQLLYSVQAFARGVARRGVRRRRVSGRGGCALRPAGSTEALWR